MGILDLTFARNEFQEVTDYEKIINQILKLDIPFTILRFNLTAQGIEVKLDVPDEKMDIVTKELKKNAVKIRRAIDIDEELCVDCGACISLCNTGALYFDEACERKFNENKCVGCLLCVDACPRVAISSNYR